SMVVMEDALPKKSDYRRFRVRTVPGNDDFAAMEEVLTRRLSAYIDERAPRVPGNNAFPPMGEVLPRPLSAYIDERALPVNERTGKFSYPPQLLLVDGGKGQLNVAGRVLGALGLAEEIPVASLAKRYEEVF